MKRQTCEACQRPLSGCYCSRIQRAHNQWPIRILQDRRESKHAIGTARIAALSLDNCDLCVVNAAAPESDIILSATRPGLNTSAGDPVLIYPGPDALPIEALVDGPIRPLVFLDASWRRSRLMLHTCPSVASLQRYSLGIDTPSRYRIRSASEPGALSTLEAIVMTLNVLEGAPKRFDGLLKTMDWMIEQQIRLMGEAVYQANYRQT